VVVFTLPLLSTVRNVVSLPAGIFVNWILEPVIELLALIKEPVIAPPTSFPSTTEKLPKGTKSPVTPIGMLY